MRYHEFKWPQGCGGRLSRLDGDVFRHRRDCRPNPNGCRQHGDGDARTSYFAHDCRSCDGEISQLPEVHDAHYGLRAVAFSRKTRSSRSVAVCQRCLRTKPRNAEKIRIINSLTGTTGHDAGVLLGLVPKYYRSGGGREMTLYEVSFDRRSRPDSRGLAGRSQGIEARRRRPGSRKLPSGEAAGRGALRSRKLFCWT